MNYQEPIIKIIMVQVEDVCTLSKEANDPWDNPNWQGD